MGYYGFRENRSGRAQCFTRGVRERGCGNLVGPSSTPASRLQTEAIGAGQDRRKSHSLRTRDGGQVAAKLMSDCRSDLRTCYA
jgi:hypothetical protein